MIPTTMICLVSRMNGSDSEEMDFGPILCGHEARVCNSYFTSRGKLATHEYIAFSSRPPSEVSLVTSLELASVTKERYLLCLSLAGGGYRKR